jgi:hypothetical protein
MGSTWGKRRGMPAYDKFVTGLTYDDVKQMLWSHDSDPKTWRYRRRGTVLGLWHQLKLEMWEQMQAMKRQRRARAAEGAPARASRIARRENDRCGP